MTWHVSEMVRPGLKMALTTLLGVADARGGPAGAAYPADMAALDRDHRACPAEEVEEMRVELTIVDGQPAYRRERHDHS